MWYCLILREIRSHCIPLPVFCAEFCSPETLGKSVSRYVMEGMSCFKVCHVSRYVMFQGMSCNTGWRRCIGCLKLQIVFRKRATNYRAFLRKSLTPYIALILGLLSNVGYSYIRSLSLSSPSHTRRHPAPYCLHSMPLQYCILSL